MKTMKACCVALATIVVMMTAAPMGNAAYATVGADVNSAYVWRGVTVNDDAVLQPSIDVTHSSGWGVNVWGNWDIGDNNGALADDKEFSEVDFTLSYGIPAGTVPIDVDLTIGNITYVFPNGGEETNELFLNIGKSVELGVPLDVGVNLYWDWDQVDDIYADVTVGHSHAASDQLSIGLNGVLGYAGSDFAAAYGGTDSGLFNWEVSVSLDYALQDNLGLSGFVAYTDSADDAVLPEQETDIYGGVGAHYSW